jgi:hypothetical protein
MNAPRAWLVFTSCVPVNAQIFTIALLGIVCYETVNTGKLTAAIHRRLTPSPDAESDLARPGPILADVLQPVGLLPAPAVREAPTQIAAENGGSLRASAIAQGKAASWHNAHSGEDDPKWSYIELGDRRKNFVKYRLFSHSDGCLDIIRSIGGKPKEVWLFNPSAGRKLHEEEPEDIGRTLDEVSTRPWDSIRLPDEMPTITAQPSADRSRRDSTHSDAFNALTATAFDTTPPIAPEGLACPATQHGSFTRHWGAVDACHLALYRSFQDGSQHYQFFNACVGMWDPQIHWTSCAPRRLAR